MKKQTGRAGDAAMAKRVERRESGDAKVEAKKCRHRREDDRTKPGDAKLSQQFFGEKQSSVKNPFLAKSECDRDAR